MLSSIVLSWLHALSQKPFPSGNLRLPKTLRTFVFTGLIYRRYRLIPSSEFRKAASTDSQSGALTKFLSVETHEKVADTQEMDEERFCDVPIIAPNRGSISPYLAIVLQVSVAIILAFFALRGVWVHGQHNAETKDIEPMTTTFRVVSGTVITALATLVSAFTSGQIKSVWLREVLQSSAQTSSLHRRQYATEVAGQADFKQQPKN